MAKPQTFEGTIKDITHQLAESNLVGYFRVIVIPENQKEVLLSAERGPSLAERMKESAGKFDSGGINLSLDTGQKFTEVLMEDHSKGAC